MGGTPGKKGEEHDDDRKQFLHGCLLKADSDESSAEEVGHHRDGGPAECREDAGLGALLREGDLATASPGELAFGQDGVLLLDLGDTPGVGFARALDKLLDGAFVPRV
jgi:hypothetical protein